jgi:ribosomal protein L7/L12
MKTDMKECKDMVDNAPFVLKKGIDQTTADYIKMSIEEVGGEIKIISNISSNDNSLYTVIFKKPGADKLQMVILLMDLMKLGLKDAKDIVDNPPSTIVEGIDKSNADFIINLIEKIGGEAKAVILPLSK